MQGTLHSLAMDTPKKRYRKLPIETEIELVRILTHPTLSKVPFHSLARERRDIFGETDSELQIRVRNRRYYLKKNPTALIKARDNLFGSPSPLSLPTVSESPSVQPYTDISTRPFFVTSPVPEAVMSSSNVNNNNPIERVAKIHKFDLDLYNPWNNPEDIFCLVGDRSAVDGVNVGTRVNLYIVINDLKDWFQGRYKMSIDTDDYGTLQLMKPSLPGFFIRKPSVIQQAETESVHQELKIDEQHKVVSATIKRNGNEHLVKKRVDLKLPSGMTASNDVYNPNAAGLELKLRLRRIGIKTTVANNLGNDVAVEQTHFFAVASFLIDGTQVPIDVEKASTAEADQLADLLGGMVTFEDS